MTVISLMLAFFCRRMVGQCHDCHIPMPNYSGYIIVISSDNSMGEKYRDAEGVVPYNSELRQFLSTGERCSPLQIIRASLSCRKIATLGAAFYFILEHNSGQLCQFLIPHSSFNSTLELSRKMCYNKENIHRGSFCERAYPTIYFR